MPIDGSSPDPLLLGIRTLNRYLRIEAELTVVTKLSSLFEYVHLSPIQSTYDIDASWLKPLNELQRLGLGWTDF